MATSKSSSVLARSAGVAAPRELQGKRDVAQLTKAIVDGLENVKAQDLMVFDTEHLSSLFERVIVASGTSNRQTKALAMSVREAVGLAGFSKPRMEGQDNGEWIIVDCGAAVVHIMQPVIRQYYNLEGIWGEKPVRVKHAAPQKAQAAKLIPEKKAPAKKAATKKAAVKTAPSPKVAAKKTSMKQVAAKKIATGRTKQSAS